MLNWVIKKLINYLKKYKEKDKKNFEKWATNKTFRMIKIKDFVIKRIMLYDELFITMYGPDSQFYLNWKDSLNVLSIDPDRS